MAASDTAIRVRHRDTVSALGSYVSTETAAARLVRRLPDRGPLLEAVGFVPAVDLIGGLPGVLSPPDGAWFRSLEKPTSIRPRSRSRRSGRRCSRRISSG